MKKNNYIQDKTLEIEFFDQVEGEYDTANHNVYTKVSEYCDNFLQGKISDILEVGCGSGKFGKSLSLLGHKVIGIDISPKMITSAGKFRVKNYQPIQGDVEDKNLFKESCFDLILCPGILHHLPSLEKSPAILNFKKWLRPGGFVVCWEPNGTNPIIFFSKLFFKLYSLFKKKNNYATSNEKNHSFFCYKRTFAKNSFDLIYSKPFSDKENVKPMGKLMLFLVILRWYLMRITDLLLIFPFSGVMLFMVFRKNNYKNLR